MSEIIRSFDPIAGARSRILVLGTMPGVMSLQKQQYYGHPRNAFWPVMASLCGTELPQRYEERRTMLLEAGIALWDVCRQCEREGSLDSRICNEEPNEIPALLRRFPDIRAIAFNGKGAEKLFRRYFGTYVDTYETLVLPSTSPAYTLTFERKLEGWQRLLPYLSGLSAGMPADTR